MKQWIMLFSASAQKKHIAISMDAPDTNHAQSGSR